jgi:hypothetical protein
MIALYPKDIVPGCILIFMNCKAGTWAAYRASTADISDYGAELIESSGQRWDRASSAPPPRSMKLTINPYDSNCSIFSADDGESILPVIRQAFAEKNKSVAEAEGKLRLKLALTVPGFELS